MSRHVFLHFVICPDDRHSQCPYAPSANLCWTAPSSGNQEAQWFACRVSAPGHGTNEVGQCIKTSMVSCFFPHVLAIFLWHHKCQWSIINGPSRASTSTSEPSKEAWRASPKGVLSWVSSPRNRLVQDSIAASPIPYWKQLIILTWMAANYMINQSGQKVRSTNPVNKSSIFLAVYGFSGASPRP